MEFKYLKLNNNDGVLKLSGRLFIHIREYASKFLVTSSMELDDGEGCYDKYINMFEDKRNHILINKDFSSKKVEIRGINVIMFNLAETSLYSICLDEYYNVWIYNKKQQTWSRLYGFDSYGKYRKVINSYKTHKDDLVLDLFKTGKSVTYDKLRFIMQQANENEFYFRLLTNEGEIQYIIIANDDKIYLTGEREDSSIKNFTWSEYKPKTSRGLFTIKIGDKVIVAQELLRTEHDLTYLADNGSIWKIRDFSEPNIVECIAKIKGGYYVDNPTKTLGIIKYVEQKSLDTLEVYLLTDKIYGIRTPNNDVIICGLNSDNSQLKFIDYTNYTNNGKSFRICYEYMKTGNKLPYEKLDITGVLYDLGYTELEFFSLFYHKGYDKEILISENGDIWMLEYNNDKKEFTKIYESTPSGYMKINKLYNTKSLRDNVEILRFPTEDCVSIYINNKLNLSVYDSDHYGINIITNDNYCTANAEYKTLMDKMRYFKERCKSVREELGIVNINGREQYATLVYDNFISDDILSHAERIYLTEGLHVYREIDYNGYSKWEHIGRID